MSYHEHRERVLQLLLTMAATGDTGLGFPEEFGGGGSVGASIAAFETLAYGDLSLLVKSGVQFGLFGGAVLHLGTRRHHERYLRAIVSDVCTRAGFPPVVLSEVNFQAMYESQQAQAASVTNGSGAVGTLN